MIFLFPQQWNHLSKHWQIVHKKDKLFVFPASHIRVSLSPHLSFCLLQLLELWSGSRREVSLHHPPVVTHIDQSPWVVGLTGTVLTTRKSKRATPQRRNVFLPYSHHSWCNFPSVVNMNAQSASMRTIKEQNPQQGSKWFFQLEKLSDDWKWGSLRVGRFWGTSPRL